MMKKVLIGIPAYNEELNIGVLLDELVDEHLGYDILVVSSGSTDRTDEIVGSFCARCEKIKLIVGKERHGKSSALNIMLRKAEAGGYEIIVYMGADNLPEKGAIERLIEEFKDSSVGVAGGRPITVDSSHHFWGWIGSLLWNVHHEVSLKEPKISGELCAYRVGIIREIPLGTVNDDAYIQLVAFRKGLRSVYVPEAKVRLKAPTGLKDFVRQRRRITMGHYQLEFLLGTRVSTTHAKRDVQLAWKARPRVGFLKEVIWMGAFLCISTAVLGLSYLDFLRRKIPYIWDIATTTKKLDR